jgi:glycosyltransferase involved in cell wall biosynthesis
MTGNPVSRDPRPGGDPIRVLYVIGSLATGGAERQLLELLARLDRSQFSPSLALLERKAGLASPVEVGGVCNLQIDSTANLSWRMLRRGSQAVRAIRRLVAFVRKAQPDLIHAMLPEACYLAVPAARMTRVPVIGSRLSLADGYRTDNRLKQLADRAALAGTDSMICNARAILSEVVEIDRFPRSRACVIYSGVDVRRFSPDADRSLRSELGWGESHLILASVANFYEYKRHIDIVRAAPLLLRRHPHARFLLLGSDRGSLTVIRREIARLDLNSYFAILEGTEPPERVHAACDLYVCSSQTEGFSSSILEAMATGKPVVATDVGGNPEAVQDGVNGFLTDSFAPEQIAARASRLLADAELRKNFGSAGRRRAMAEFSLERMAQSHEQLYRRLVVPRAAHA